MDLGDTTSTRGAAVRPVQLEEIADAPQAGRGVLLPDGLRLVHGVKVDLTVAVGSLRLSVGELLALKEAAVLSLDRATSDPIDVLLDGKLVARGELMAAGDQFAVRITEIGERD
jgi:flagellar motor switch protein FliN/FliY